MRVWQVKWLRIDGHGFARIGTDTFSRGTAVHPAHFGEGEDPGFERRETWGTGVRRVLDM